MAKLLTSGRTGGPGRGRGEDGIAMVMAVIITGVVFLLGAVWVAFAEHAASSSRYARHREQAVDAAHAGLAEAAAALSRNSGYTGTALTDFPGGSAQYEVAVAADASVPGAFRRVVTATGYAPSPDAPGRARRTLRQVVDLDPVAFQYALLSESNVSTGSSSAITGDIYANGDITLGNSQDYVGHIHVRGNLATGSNQSITGDIHADGDVKVQNSSTRVRGSVYAGGSITTGGTIEDDAVAGGTIGCGQVAGTCSPGTPPAPVPEQHLPTFTWDKANYSPVGVEHASGAALVQSVATTTRGAHRAPGDVAFGKEGTLTLTGDLTIVATGSIDLPRTIVNGTNHPVQLSIISSGGGTITPSNNFTIPSTVLTLFYTTGQFDAKNSSSFNGALYAGSLSSGAHTAVRHAVLDDTGFDWSGANPQSFGIRNVSTREVSS